MDQWNENKLYDMIHWLCFFVACNQTAVLILTFFCNPSLYPAASVSYDT